MKLKRIDVLSFATVSGLLYAALGLIFGALISLVAFMGFAIGGSSGGSQGIIGLVMGLGGIIFMPLFYGALGFIFGALAAWLYNIIARRTGGIELEFDNM